MAYGLKLSSHIYGSPYNAQVRMYYMAAGDPTATFLGDLVKSAGSADATTGVPTVNQVAAGETSRGVVVGFNPIMGVAIGSENLNRKYRPASTAMYVWVVDDPNAIFQIASSGTVQLVDVGENCDVVVGAGSTVTGLSGMALDAQYHTASSAQLRILGFGRTPGNVPASASADIIVMINEHELKSTSGV